MCKNIEKLLDFMSQVPHITNKQNEDLGNAFVDVIVTHKNHICCCSARRERFRSLMEMPVVAANVATLTVNEPEYDFCLHGDGHDFYNSSRYARDEEEVRIMHWLRCEKSFPPS